MGTWGFDSFDDDDALDWIADFEKAGMAVVIESIADVTTSTGYLQTDVCSRALAACEAMAALAGRPSPGLPQALWDWVTEHSQLVFDGSAIAGAGCRALDIVLTERSELHQRWRESDSYDEWRHRVLDLRGRLSEFI